MAETKQICEELINGVFQVEFSKAEKDFLTMSSALIKGVWCVQPFLNENVIMAYIYNRLLILKNKSINLNRDLFKSNFTIFEKFYFRYYVTAMYRMQYSIFRILANLLQYSALWFMENFPFLAYYKFGIANSHVEILN